MSLGRRAIITGAQREELWRRYKAGETILGIGRALGQRPTTIHRVLQATGGIGLLAAALVPASAAGRCCSHGPKKSGPRCRKR